MIGPCELKFDTCNIHIFLKIKDDYVYPYSKKYIKNNLKCNI